MRCAQRRPFLRRFLDAIFAEVRDPGGDQRLDFRHAALLGHRDQRHFRQACGAPPLRHGAIWSRTVARRVAASVMPARYRKRDGSEPAPMAAPSWLMTDERIGDAAVAGDRPAAGAAGGIVFRHYSLPAEERAALGRTVARICAERGLGPGVSPAMPASPTSWARRWSTIRPGRTASAAFRCRCMTKREAFAARASRAALVFVSPVFPTRIPSSDAAALGADRAAGLARMSGCPCDRAWRNGRKSRTSTRCRRAWILRLWLGIDVLGDLELEGGADVDRLAVALRHRPAPGSGRARSCSGRRRSARCCG